MARQIFYPSKNGYVFRATDEGCSEWVGYYYDDTIDYPYNEVYGTPQEVCEPITSGFRRAFIEFNINNLIPHINAIKKLVLRVRVSSVTSARTRYVLILSSRPSDYGIAQAESAFWVGGSLVYSGSVTSGWVEYDLGEAGITALKNHTTWFAIGLYINELLNGTYGATSYYGLNTTSKPELHVYWRRRQLGG